MPVMLLCEAKSLSNQLLHHGYHLWAVCCCEYTIDVAAPVNLRHSIMAAIIIRKTVKPTESFSALSSEIASRCVFLRSF